MPYILKVIELLNTTGNSLKRTSDNIGFETLL